MSAENHLALMVGSPFPGVHPFHSTNQWSVAHRKKKTKVTYCGCSHILTDKIKANQEFIKLYRKKKKERESNGTLTTVDIDTRLGGKYGTYSPSNRLCRPKAREHTSSILYSSQEPHPTLC